MFVTITGQYQRSTGDPATGGVTFTLVPAVRLPGTGLIAAATAVTLNGAGAFAVDLLATTDPAVLPAGACYVVDERIDGARRAYAVTVPHDAGASLALSSLPRVEA